MRSVQMATTAETASKGETETYPVVEEEARIMAPSPKRDVHTRLRSTAMEVCIKSLTLGDGE